MKTVYQVTRIADPNNTQLDGDFSTFDEARQAIILDNAQHYECSEDTVANNIAIKNTGPLSWHLSHGDDLSHEISECLEGTFMNLPQWEPNKISPEVTTRVDEDLLKLLDRRLRGATELWKNFLVDLAKHPCSNIEKMTQYYGAAIAVEEIPRLIEWVTERDGTREQVIAQLKEGYTRIGRAPSYSTSPTYNALQIERASWMIRLVENLEDLS